jgi:predicted peroxiredoxin
MKNVTGTEILAVIDGMKVQNSDRVTMSIMLHDVVFDNQRAIFDLVSLGHIRSASALLRVVFEAHVKGIWMYSCATDKQISQFKKDSVKSTVKPKCGITFNEMISDIEAELPHLNGTLSEFKKKHWKGLNCLTHSGTM